MAIWCTANWAWLQVELMNYSKLLHKSTFCFTANSATVYLKPLHFMYAFGFFYTDLTLQATSLFYQSAFLLFHVSGVFTSVVFSLLKSNWFVFLFGAVHLRRGEDSNHTRVLTRTAALRPFGGSPERFVYGVNVLRPRSEQLPGVHCKYELKTASCSGMRQAKDLYGLATSCKCKFFMLSNSPEHSTCFLCLLLLLPSWPVSGLNIVSA